jgi:hypothetical protein
MENDTIKPALTVLETPQAWVWWEHGGQRVYSAVLPLDEAEMRLAHLRSFRCMRITAAGVEPVIG